MMMILFTSFVFVSRKCTTLHGSSHLASLLANASVVGGSVLLKHGKCFALCRVVRVGIIKQILNPQKDLFDGDGGFPTLVFVENAKADGTRGKDVGMEERWCELALGRFAGVFFWESHAELVEAALPWCLYCGDRRWIVGRSAW